MKNRKIRNFLNNTPVVKSLHYKALFAYHKHYTKVVKRDPAKKVIRLIGLRRSGNHAIINWILNQHYGLVNFCNDLMPFQYPEDALTKETRFNQKREDVFEKASYPEQNCLIYSYEDRPIKVIFGDESEKIREQMTGGAGISFDGIIIRDPFNQFASWSVWQGNAGNQFRESSAFRKEITDTWKSYAREALNQTEVLRHNKTVLNFNHWVTDKAYRKKLASHLMLHFTDEGVKSGNVYGKGSSFTPGETGSQDASTGVLQRWMDVRDSDVFQSVFDDHEIWELSEQLFGEIPGTREWRQKIS